MALNTVLLLAAGIGTNIGFQDPGFDLQFALPALDQSTVGQPVQPSEQPTSEFIAQNPTTVQGYSSAAPAYVAQQKRVSASFKSAKISEVLAWLEQNGVSFVVADGAIPAGSNVTLNIVDQPVDDVADAIAVALGGHWVRQNNVRVFRNGPSPMAMPFTVPGRAVPAVPPMVRDLQVQGQYNKEMAKEMELMAKDLQKQFGPEFQKKMAEMAKQQVEVYVQGKDGKLEKRVLKPGEKMTLPLAEIEMLREQGKLSPLTRVQIEEMQAKVKGEMITPQKLEELRKAGKVRVVSPAEAEKIRAEAMKSRAHGEQIRKEVVERLRVEGVRKGEHIRLFGERGERAHMVDAKRFIDSLTPDQKHSMRMRGYILYIDLTAEQRKMLGNRANGKWEIKMRSNDQEVVVRGS